MGREAGSSKSSLKHIKRSRVAESAEQLLKSFSKFFCKPAIHSNSHVYDLQLPGERARLIVALWAGDWVHDETSSLSAENPDLCEFLESSTVDGREVRYRSLKVERVQQNEVANGSRWEAVLLTLTRWHSIHRVPILCAVLTIRFWHHHMQTAVWRAMTTLFRIVLSRTWIESFLPDARERDPGPRYDVAPGVSAAAFDNFSIRASGGMQTEDSPGSQINMTNWASLALPRMAVGDSLAADVSRMLRSGDSLFREDLDLKDFKDLFSPINPELVRFRDDRFAHYMHLSESSSLDQRPSPVLDLPPTHLVLHDPIWDRLQSSYDDVEAELKLIRKNPSHCHSSVLFIGCGGAGYSRMIHRLSHNPTCYLMTEPVVIPQLGEHPHGSFHVLHAGWRLWWPLIERFTTLLNHTQVRADPIVSQFNQHEHFLRILTAGFCKWLVSIARTGMRYQTVQPFMRACESNLSCACIVHFIYDFAFLFKSLRDGVRANDSKQIDLCWRDFLAMGRTSDSNKTQYSQMAVVRIYWGIALNEPLRSVYHRIRSLKLVHSHVGWDMFIERVNLSIRRAVKFDITREHLRCFLRHFGFTDLVDRSIDELLDRADDGRRTLKDISGPVQNIFEFLNTTIGSTFAEATNPSNNNLLSLDLASWDGGRNDMQLNSMPWEKVRKENAGEKDYREYVERHITRLCPWHHWADG